MARAADGVDAVVGVAGVDEDLLVLLEPVLHRVPVERDAIRDLPHGGERFGVGPDAALGDAPASLDGPVARVALERAMRVVARWREQVEAHVDAGEVPDGQVTALVQEQHVARVDDGLAAEHPAHPPSGRLEVDRVLLRWIAHKVERTGRPRPERACSRHQPHRRSSSLTVRRSLDACPTVKMSDSVCSGVLGAESARAGAVSGRRRCTDATTSPETVSEQNARASGITHLVSR